LHNCRIHRIQELLEDLGPHEDQANLEEENDMQYQPSENLLPNKTIPYKGK
jgi:hypothetical protein